MFMFLLLDKKPHIEKKRSSEALVLGMFKRIFANLHKLGISLECTLQNFVVVEYFLLTMICH